MDVRPARPADPLRSHDLAELLRTARAAALQAGVTRLADITLLDTIGLPVWQAIRPASRALSVHQGKGWTAEEAKVGALLEAVESHWAEDFAAPVRRCRWRDLQAKARPPSLADLAANRERPPEADALYDWVEAERLDGQGAMFLPFDLVSLDFTCRVPSPFDRASNGVATGVSRAEAVLASLHELVERDALAEWGAMDLHERMECMLDPASVGQAWFHHLRDAVERAGARLRCYTVPSLIGTPVFACEVSDLGKAARPFRATSGHAAHPSKKVALFKAVTEAIQSRAAFIAGARDDLYPWRYCDPRDSIEVAFGLPLPPGADAADFKDVPDGPATLDGLLEALARAGFPDAAAVTLAEPEGLCVVRSFVCGLGSPTRLRRRET
jgi:ribosomal protein S12 methylthiotransferase accessory factor